MRKPSMPKRSKGSKPKRQVELSYEATIAAKGTATISQYDMDSARDELEDGIAIGTVEAWLKNGLISNEFHNSNESDIELTKVGFVKPHACSSPNCNLKVDYQVDYQLMCSKHMNEEVALVQCVVKAHDAGEWQEIDKTARLDSVFPPREPETAEPAEEDWPA